jgi:hypothetical protein
LVANWQAEVGRVFKRCGCRSAETGRQLGAHCKLLSEDGHRRWYFAVQVIPHGLNVEIADWVKARRGWQRVHAACRLNQRIRS